ncbi:MAG: DUF3788 domain-containing protein [Clostridia bacterium]|nr:DUF3788 domain-containing protein [Clostridia bacterium]
MEWKTLFPKNHQPSLEEIAEYIGGEAKPLWESLLEYMDKTYKVKPKLTYSVCSGKPGWNIKFARGGQSYGTLYPEENSFSVFVVIAYKLDPFMEGVLPRLSEECAERYRSAGDYMKMGRWMMFQINDQAGVEEYKNLVSVKAYSKIA